MDTLKIALILCLVAAGLYYLNKQHSSEVVSPEQVLGEDPVEHFKKVQMKGLLLTLEQAKQDASKTCRKIDGNITTAKVFAQLKIKLPVSEPNQTFYKVKNITKTFYKVCVVGNKVYIPICRFEGCNPVECGIEEYHCFAPIGVDEAPFYFTSQPYAWTIVYNESLTDHGIQYPKRFIGVHPGSPRFYELRYVGEVYSGQPLGEEIVKGGD